jgi:hypothetical protein
MDLRKMKKNHLQLCAGALVITILCLAIFLKSDSGNEVAGTGKGPKKPGSQAGISNVSLSARQAAGGAELASGLQRSKGPLAPAKKIPEIEKTPPGAYSSAPKPGTTEAEVLKIVNDRLMPDRTKVQRLLAMIAGASDAHKALALDHATQLIPDEEYVGMRQSLLQLAETEALKEVVLLDVLTRGDTIRMPSLVEFLRQPAYEGQAEIKQILVDFLEKDYGNDLRQWDVAVQRFLAENAEG